MDFEGQRYYDAGQSFRNAYTILEQKCRWPPSFEVFCQELKAARERTPGTDPEMVARRIVNTYDAKNFFGYQ